ncbi:hypothetical protein Btru_072451 [Bulinus truncatus]|nr:hypothetical protein Btru_072451 [Bulinus truncatus]
MKESQETGREKLLLTLATASGTYYIDQSYEPYKIINYIDYMLLMTYNYHGQWEKKTGHHSGLYPHKDDPKHGEKSQLYQEWSIDYWLSIGISKDKLVVGIPTYGMTFTLADDTKHGVNALTIGGGEMGQYTKESGILAYYEVCINLRDRGWTKEWIDDQMVPYAYRGDQWVGYEDRRSVAFKAANIIKRDLAGAFVWSVEMDDFGDVCGQGHHPLLSTLVDALGHGPVSQTAARERVTPINTDVGYTEDGRHRVITTLAPGDYYGDSPFSTGIFSPAAGGSTSPSEEKSSEVILNYSIIRKNKSGPRGKPPAVPTRQQNLVRISEDFSTTPIRPTDMPYTLPGTKSLGVSDYKPSQDTMENPQKKPKPVIKLETPRLVSSSILNHKTKDLSLSIPYWIKPAAAAGSSVSFTANPVAMETMTSKYGNKFGHVTMWWARPYPIDESKSRTNSASGFEHRVKTTKSFWWRQRSEQPKQKEPSTQAKSKNEVKVKGLELPSKDGYYVVSSWSNNNNNIGADDNNRWWAAGVPRQKHSKSGGPTQFSGRSRVKFTTADPASTRPDVLTPSNKSILVRQEVCRERGIGTFADPLSCDHFIMCLPGNWMDFPPPVMACPAGTRFDTRLKVCNYASDVTCLQ